MLLEPHRNSLSPRVILQLPDLESPTQSFSIPTGRGNMLFMES